MQLSRLRLRSYKCYERLDVELADGVTVIHGVNGSGKTSLLEACFFALYGADSLPSGETLEAVITKGSSETEVELWFEHAGAQYQLERTIRTTDTQLVHDAVLQLQGETIEGVTAIEEFIEDLLRMDAEAFLNCAYVRQGDIARLLTASPEERQRMLDELLQLGVLEAYRERMDQARLGVDRIRRDRASKLEDVHEEVSSLEEQELQSRLGSITDRLEVLGSQVSEVEETLEAHRDELDEVTEEIAGFEERREALGQLTDEIDDHEEQLDEARERQSSTRADITELKEAVEELVADLRRTVEDLGMEVTVDPDQVQAIRAPIEAAVESVTDRLESTQEDIETTREQTQEAAAAHRRCLDRAEACEEQAATHEDRAKELATEADDKAETVTERLEKLSEQRDELATKRSAFDEACPEEFDRGQAAAYRDHVEERLADLRETEREVETELETITQRIDHAETLLEHGNCPTCGQAVADAPEVDTLEDDRTRAEEVRERLEKHREEVEKTEAELNQARELVAVETEIEQLESQCSSLEELLEAQREAVTSKREAAEEAREAAEEQRAEAAAQREKATDHEAERDEMVAELEALQETASSLEERREDLAGLLSVLDEVDRSTEQLEAKRSQLEDIEALVEHHESALEEFREERRELEDALDEDRLRTLQDRREELEATIEELEEERENIEAEQNDYREQRGEVRAAIERLEEVRERKTRLERQVEALAGVVEECATTQEMYASLRTELRQRNVRQLEQLLNDIFDLVYQNDSYARIELSNQYELTVFEKSGEALAPDELSGGEQAIFNLSLRCATYQLLAEGVGGESPLPPLILDEPTVHLDAEHVNRLGDLVNRMRQLGVNQTVVVSHEAELVDSADERIEVRQNPSTNRSSVNVESTDLLAGLVE